MELRGLTATEATIKDLCSANTGYECIKGLCYVKAEPVVTSRGCLGTFMGDGREYTEVVDTFDSFNDITGDVTIVRTQEELRVEMVIDLNAVLNKPLRGMSMSIRESDCQLHIMEYKIKDRSSKEMIIKGALSLRDPETIVDKETGKWNHSFVIKRFTESQCDEVTDESEK